MIRLIVALVLSASIAPVAFAADDRAADAMIARGLELRRQEKPAEALEMFQRAHAVAPSPRTFGQMGLVETSLDHWTDAEDHLTQSLLSPQDPWVKKNRTTLDQALTIARSHIGQISFSGPTGAAITVAGKLVGNLPNVPPVRVGEGNVLVTAVAPGFKQFLMSVPVQPGMQTPLTIVLDRLELQPPPAAANQSPPVTAMTELKPRYSWRMWTGSGLVGVGAGLLTWGIVWIAVDGNSSGGACAPSAPSPCMPVYDTKTPGWILAGVGAAAAAGGGYLLYAAKNSGKDVTIGFGPTSVVLGGRF